MFKDKNYVISRMTQEEIPIAIAWAREEGWNPGLHDGECFYRADPQGFFVGKIDGKIIAIGSAVVYDEYFAFCGFYKVDKAYRNQGYGLALTQERLKYVGTRNAGIDGVVSMLKKYERLGYRIAHNNARYQGTHIIPVKPKPNPNLLPLSEVPWTALSHYDRLHFPAHRDEFLFCWIHQKGAKFLGYTEKGDLLGYGVIRPCYEGFKIGPLFAYTPEIAEELFVHLAAHASKQPFYLDIPECNPEAVKLVNKYQMEKVFATARMYLRGVPEIALDEIYGITSFELG